MKRFLYFLLTAFVSTGAMFAGLNQHQVLLGYGIAFTVWACFLWSFLKRSR